jgi:hypothetical protein
MASPHLLSVMLFLLVLAGVAHVAKKFLAFFSRLIYTYTYVSWVLEAALRRATLTLGYRYLKHISGEFAKEPLQIGMTGILNRIYYMIALFGLIMAGLSFLVLVIWCCIKWSA